MSVSQPTPSTSANNSSTPIESTPYVKGVDRRKRSPRKSTEGPETERRQFGNTYSNLSQEGQELAEAIDRYKMQNRRRYITTDEIILVLKELGYSKK